MIISDEEYIKFIKDDGMVGTVAKLYISCLKGESDE